MYLYRGTVSERCQVTKTRAIVIAGPAGCGKTTLGRALAARLGWPLLDLDSLTTALLDALPESAVGGSHWLASEHASAIRAGRYAALRATAADLIATAGCVVLVAPFTAELRGGAEWDALVAALAVAPASAAKPEPAPELAAAPEPELAPTVFHLVGDPAVVAARRTSRAEPRDAHRPSDTALEAPAVPTIAVEIELSTSQQLARMLPTLGIRNPVDPGNTLLSCTFDAVLFDLDGTLVDSTASVIRSWRRFAEHYQVSMDALHRNHGQPARELIRRLLPTELEGEALARITALEVSDAVGLRPVPGAAELIQSLPEARKAIVTSGSMPIASARLAAASIPCPEVIVTADDVVRGKPDPEPFLLAAARLGVDASRCLVVEDAAAGISAAVAAGCAVLAVAGTADAAELGQAVMIVDGLDRVRVQVSDRGVQLSLAPSE